ncbi:MAG: hypothetical protein HGA33_02165 [Candidatus Moranbacteria bacterium]|nr:hypothetical protein [Candidatus Moranbacteria bacterium]
MKFTTKNCENLAKAGIMIFFSACVQFLLPVYLFLFLGVIHPALIFSVFIVVANSQFIKRISQMIDAHKPAPDEKALAYGTTAATLSGIMAILVTILAIALPTIINITDLSTEEVTRGVSFVIAILSFINIGVTTVSIKFLTSGLWDPRAKATV